MAGDDITILLRQWADGDTDSLDRLTARVYDELRGIALQIFRGERADHTLQATALVNEAYARLIGSDIDWQDRGHFFSLAARLMRRILVDHANAHGAAKRGSGVKPLPLDDVIVVSPELGEEVLDLHEALNELAEHDERKAHILELNYFGGLTYADMAKALNLSSSTLDREIRFAKAWLKSRLSP
ncbi:MAG: sigma-70 family RNA polymerase sigma factor [Pseudomonadota bacterium]